MFGKKKCRRKQKEEKNVNLNVKKSMSIVWQSQYNKIILSENDRDTKRRIQMKKRVLSMLLVASMTGALLAGCGSGETASTDASADAAADTNTAAAGTETDRQMRLRQTERQSLSNGQSGIRRPLLLERTQGGI